MLKNLYTQLKSRGIRKTMAIYVSSALTAIAVVRLFTDVYSLPPLIFPVVVVLLTCGVASAFLIAWFHGAADTQRIRAHEIGLHAIVLVIAVILSFRVGGTRPRISSTLDPRTVAVLPFENMSGNKEDEYFTDGVTEDILTQLSKIGDLKVISRTSVMRYKETVKTIGEIAAELQAGSILEGSVRRVGERVRIVGQLINAATDEHIWAEAYDRKLSDIFAIQTDVAQRIAGELKARLSPDETRRLTTQPTNSLEAYGYYLRGRDYYYRYTKENNERAIELFWKALSLDTNYALANAGLSGAYSRRQYYDFSPSSSRSGDSAFALAMKSIAIDPNLAEGHKALGDVYDSREEYRAALAQYMKAVELNPNYAPAIANTGHEYFRLGMFDEALQWMRKAMTVEPGTARWSSNIGLQYFYLGYDSLATVWLRKALTLQPEFFFPEIILTYIDLYAGRYDSAESRIERVIAAHPGALYVCQAGGDVALIRGKLARARTLYEKEMELSSVQSQAGIQTAYVLMKLGREKDARALLDSILTPDADDLSQYHDGSLTYYYACAYCLVHNYPKATELLNKAMELGFVEYRWIVIDPLIDPLRETRDFKEIMASLNHQHQEMRKRVEQREALDREVL